MRTIKEKELRDAVYKNKAAEIKPLPKKASPPPAPTTDLAPLVDAINRSIEVSAIATESILELAVAMKARSEQPIVVKGPALKNWEEVDLNVERDYSGQINKLKLKKRK